MKKQTKQNSYLNGEWAQHVRRWLKKHTNGQRRANSKEIIRRDLKEWKLKLADLVLKQLGLLLPCSVVAAHNILDVVS